MKAAMERAAADYATETAKLKPSKPPEPTQGAEAGSKKKKKRAKQKKAQQAEAAAAVPDAQKVRPLQKFESALDCQTLQAQRKMCQYRFVTQKHLRNSMQQ